MTPILSVVTPTLNQASFLEETLASVRAQDLPGVEHVVVDGGSKDGTLEILARHASTVRFVSVPGEGQSAAVNRGLKMTSGPIVGWLNSDDTYLPGALSAVSSFFLTHREVDVLYGDCWYVDRLGIRLRRYETGPPDPPRWAETVANEVPQPSAFVRRSILEAVGGLDPKLHYAMDLDLWLRLAAEGARFSYLPTFLATLRLHEGAKSVARLEGFAPEIVAVVERALSLGLPRRADRALSNAHYRAAQLLFWSGHEKEARRHALEALCASPSNLRRTLLYAFGGRPMRLLLGSLRGNPFTGGR
jgi:glycosyltransferase involved in cell wall biosynthesis